MSENIIQLDGFLAYTIGIIVYLAGMRINAAIPVLRNYNIPEPVTGGIVASLLAFAVYSFLDTEIVYDLAIRDILLVYFFTTIGLNARFSDLIAGGKPLILLLCLTLGYIVIQDVIGVLAAVSVGQPAVLGILTGSTSLIGGHGTAIAWAPEIRESYGIASALEIGAAAATLGLVIASLIGGPVAKFLLTRHQLSGDSDEPSIVGLPHAEPGEEKITHTGLMRVILVVHVAMILGYMLNGAIAATGFKLPLFVSCLLVAILMSNTVPKVLPRMRWPAGSSALALVSDFSLGLFIAMSLMGMQLWSIADLAGPLLIILAIQTVAAVLFIILILFRVMGRDYLAAVLSAGFAGFSLGATPTAIANMTAVTKSHGPAPTAFIILPLVGAFFVDITNAFIIQFALQLIQ